MGLWWMISKTYWIGFYVASTLLAFNVFTAFSIDVYSVVQELHADKDVTDKSDAANEASVTDQAPLGNTMSSALLHQEASEDLEPLGTLMIGGLPGSWKELQLHTAF